MYVAKYFAIVLLMFNVMQLMALEIRIPAKATNAEKTAANELATYIHAISGKNAVILPESNDISSQKTFFVGDTSLAQKMKIDSKSLPKESWSIKSINGNLVLSGSLPRGIHHAVYHYLEDCCGCRFWTPFEESVPKLDDMPISEISKQGTLPFSYPGLHSIVCRDNGKFAAKRRICSALQKQSSQRNPDKPDEDFGLRLEFGPPDFAHTFKKYMPPAKYFSEHPEWFALSKNGTRDTAPNAQLCLSNLEMRKELTKNVLAIIRESREKSAKDGTEPFTFFDLSHNDHIRFCNCPECKKIVQKYGDAQSGIMIETVNEVAKAIAKEYPDIVLNTFAYQYTEKLPSGIKPEKNVCITLCDTVTSYAFASDDDINKRFLYKINDWGKISPMLRIWDYYLTYRWRYGTATGLPFANEDVFNRDMKVFRQCNVQHIFAELENYIISDVRDFKVWMFSQTSENPDADPEALLKEFAYGYYGKAGKQFIEYRKLLRASQEKWKPYISMVMGVGANTHLDLETVTKAQQLFADGEKLVADDPELARRWRHARLALDRAVIQMQFLLQLEYYRRYGSLKNYPFDTNIIQHRIEKTFNEQVAFREKLLNRYAIDEDTRFLNLEKKLFFNQCFEEKNFAYPKFFAALDPSQYVDFTPFCFDLKGSTEIVKDSEAECGYAACELLPEDSNSYEFKNYTRNFESGLYSHWIQDLNQNHRVFPISKFVQGPGYNWYKINSGRILADQFLYFPWNWHIQLNLGKVRNIFPVDTEYDIYANLKFTGSAFPYGKKGDPNAIWCERIVLVPIPEGIPVGDDDRK